MSFITINDHFRVEICVEESLGSNYLTFKSQVDNNSGQFKIINMMKIPLNKLDILIDDLNKIREEHS
ncbi:MAG: hypothetical protein IPH62_19940 [Ignavibacteriae bacterium]|nr:hypothetical protein [Ignavibacteriota bacterium]